MEKQKGNETLKPQFFSKHDDCPVVLLLCLKNEVLTSSLLHLSFRNITLSTKCILDHHRKCNTLSPENETEPAIHIFSRDIDVTLFLKKNQQQF